MKSKYIYQTQYVYHDSKLKMKFWNERRENQDQS